VHALFEEFLTNFFQLMYEAWVAPPDQAARLISALLGRIVYLFLVFIIIRWMWRKLWKS